MAFFNSNSLLCNIIFCLLLNYAFGALQTQLVGLGTPNAGRIEVLYNSAWGTVCSDFFSSVGADVVCKSLGFKNESGFVYPSSPFPASTGSILLDDVRCTGNETNIDSCPHSPIGVHNCNHTQDVAISCGRKLQLRLVGGTSSYGRLEVYYNNSWGTVCDDYFDNKAANLACQALGFSSGVFIQAPSRLPGNLNIILDDVRCQGVEPDIGFCPHLNFYNHNCVHEEDVVINCTTVATPVCAPPADPTPILDSTGGTFYSNNSLSFKVISPRLANRTIIGVQVGGSSLSSCSFPGNLSLIKNDCNDVVTAQIPWAIHESCNITKKLSTANYDYYNASIFVTSLEILPPIRGRPVNRTTTDILKLSVKFPRFISVSRSVNVFAPVNLIASVVQQSFSPVTGKGSITLGTSLQWPFKLSSFNISEKPNGLQVGSLSGGSSRKRADECGSSENSPCFQEFTFEIAPESTACKLSGTYVANFTVQCRGSNECPLDNSTKSVGISFSIVSSDFCASLETGVSVNSVLDSYADSTFKTLRGSFFTNQRAYFKVKTDSPEAAITSTRVENVFLQGSNTSLLYSNTNESWALVSDVATGSNYASFSVLFSTNYFPVAVDQRSQYSIVIDVVVGFQGNNKKRFTFETSALNSRATSSFELVGDESAAPTQNNDNNNGATSSQLHPLLLFVTSLVLLIWNL